jgi:hypothetical protein
VIDVWSHSAQLSFSYRKMLIYSNSLCEIPWSVRVNATRRNIVKEEIY